MTTIPLRRRPVFMLDDTTPTALITCRICGECDPSPQSNPTVLLCARHRTNLRATIVEVDAKFARATAALIGLLARFDEALASLRERWQRVEDARCGAASGRADAGKYATRLEAAKADGDGLSWIIGAYETMGAACLKIERVYDWYWRVMTEIALAETLQ